jgi:hypothetical protein
MKVLFVAGRFDEERGRPSGYMRRLNQAMRFETTFINGGHINHIPPIYRDLDKYDAVLWFIDAPNWLAKSIKDIKRDYPKIILVTSKRNLKDEGDNYSLQEVVARALKLKSNLVLELSGSRDRVVGSVLDPLGVFYCHETANIYGVAEALSYRVKRLTEFTRVASVRTGGSVEIPPEHPFFDIVKMQADRFHEIIHGVNHERMMGNASFRCARGFPSMRDGGIAFVSRRNVDKRFIGPESFVAVDLDSVDPVRYFGPHKPSVDTPVQVKLYRYYDQVRYIVHSHTYIKGAHFTGEPVPCGATEEFDLIKEMVPHRDASRFAINLRGHGSIVLGDCVDYMRGHPWEPRPVPEIV